jgi:hypothetical protein
MGVYKNNNGTLELIAGRGATQFPKTYFYSGNVITGAVTGYGSLFVTVYDNGIWEAEVSALVPSNSLTNRFDYGIPFSKIATITGKTIAGKKGGALSVFNSSGSYLFGLATYGFTWETRAISSESDKWFVPARVYQTSGTTGAYPTSAFSNCMLVGPIHGTWT